MILLVGLDLHKDREISEFYYLQTLQEYVAYIARSTNTMKSKANRIDNDYKKYNSHMLFPSHSDLPTPDEFEEALRSSGELDDKFRYRLRSIGISMHIESTKTSVLGIVVTNG